MSDADNKAISTVTVARQPPSASMWTLNKDTGPDRLLILITDKNAHMSRSDPGNKGDKWL